MTSVSKINLIDIINTIDRALDAPPTCIESLLDREPLADDLLKELDAIISVMLVEVIKNSARNLQTFSKKLPSNFLYNCKTVTGIRSVNYSEWVKLAEVIDSRDMSPEEYGYIKILIIMNSKKHYVLSSSMISCYFLNTV